MADSFYMRKGMTTLKFDKTLHNYERLLADGWIVYDPNVPGDASCTDTHRNKGLATRPPCLHGYTWWCPKAPHANWYPEAPFEEDRDLDRVLEKKRKHLSNFTR